jgi:hypothetical protein
VQVGCSWSADKPGETGFFIGRMQVNGKHQNQVGVCCSGSTFEQSRSRDIASSYEAERFTGQQVGFGQERQERQVKENFFPGPIDRTGCKEPYPLPFLYIKHSMKIF